MKQYYDRSQVAWLIVIIYLALNTWIVVKIWGESGQEPVYFVFAITILVPVLLGRIQVTVDKTNLRIRFLLGFPRATVPLTNIKNVETYQEKRMFGFGFKLKPSQGQYHISGSGGVVVMRHEGTPLMISSPEPERLKSALDKARAKNKE